MPDNRVSLRGIESYGKAHLAAKSAITSHHSRFPIQPKPDIYFVVLHNKIKYNYNYNWQVKLNLQCTKLNLIKQDVT